MAKRGQLRIYLGAAPGVGKTFAMLNEGLRRRDRGTDVVVGFVETHGRKLTAAQIEDLEVIPRRSIEYKGTAFEEMDIDAVLARGPQVALVDELAHTNVPGSRHTKRWQDVQELRNAGIDVVSTLNVQHLDSLNDVLEDITGVRQQETIPDAVVRSADQIELVDMTPEALTRRMAHGNIYPAERIDAALANYFRKGNLAALREIALLWVADRVDEYLGRYREEHDIETQWETRERVVVSVTGAPGGEQLIRRAARIAERSHGELLGVRVIGQDGLVSDTSAQFDRQRALLQAIGGEFHEVVGSDVAGSLVQFAHDENATQLVLGATRRSRWQEITTGSVINKVIRESGPIDVHVISYEEAGEEQGASQASWRRPRAAPLTRRRTLAGWGLAALGLPLLTLVLVSTRDELGLPSQILLYLLFVVLVATVGGTWPAIAAAFTGFLCLNWYFTPPIHTLTIADPENLFALVAFLIVAGVVSTLVSLAARRRHDAHRSSAIAEALGSVAGALLSTRDALPELVERMRTTFGQDAVAVLVVSDDDSTVEVSAGENPPTRPEEAGLCIPLEEDSVLALRGPRLTSEDRRVLTAFADQLVLAQKSRKLEEDAARAHALEEADELRNAVLNAVSHDLRTPLASILASVTTLLQPRVEIPPAERGELLTAIRDQTERLDHLVGNLLDMSRIQTGALQVSRFEVGVDEIVHAALQSLPEIPKQRVVVDVPEDLPAIEVDPTLLERAVANLISNAAKWSPADIPVHVTAGAVQQEVLVRVVDHGPGIAPADHETIFEPFRRLEGEGSDNGVGLGLAVAKGFVESVGGSIEVDDTPGGGLTVSLRFPVVIR
ncbi:MAG: sensor histidine kinase KdpD [Acidimicrobiia bacterium]|nr:sensor histidine kinase KdpD [Acidimicrobiia bacterium]